ncbi:hypothetical protein, partial [Bifidobacterium sp.]|uniref:hypothetical protein n=1 Tax=Bifidobacterium sp. TaxID=41200 RepID=UPI003865C0C5
VWAGSKGLAYTLFMMQGFLMHWVSTYTPRDDSPPAQSCVAQSFVSFVHQHPCHNPNTQRIRRSGHGFRCFRHRFHCYSHFFVCLLTKTAKTVTKTANPP